MTIYSLKLGNCFKLSLAATTPILPLKERLRKVAAAAVTNCKGAAADTYEPQMLTLAK